MNNHDCVNKTPNEEVAKCVDPGSTEYSEQSEEIEAFNELTDFITGILGKD